jgi:AraC-like DNA-binding protein
MRHSIRATWLRRVVDSAQVLGGALESQQLTRIRTALRRFEAVAGSPRTAAERLVLRGLTLDLYLLAETRLAAYLPEAARAAARSELCVRREDGARRFVRVMDDLLTTCGGSWSAAPHEQARRWIDENPGARMSVEQLAAELHVHPRTLRRHFLRHIGITLQEHQRKCRASYVAQLLSQRREKTAAIAVLAGVKSRSTLYRLLRRYSIEARPGRP